MIRGLGLRDPGSNPGIPIYIKCQANQKKQKQQAVLEPDMGKNQRQSLRQLNQNKEKSRNALFAESLGLSAWLPEFGNAKEKHAARNLPQAHII